MQGNMAALHDRFHGCGEVFAAFLFGTTIDASALCLIGMTNDAAMRTNRAIGPKNAF
jgi:hypothetical protein